MKKKGISRGLLALLLLTTSSLLNTSTAFAAECAASSTYSNGYLYFAFKDSTASCIWTVPADAAKIDYLVVAGGGSGGARHAGGGGAGGALTGSGISLSGITSLNVSVGAGGAATTPTTNNWSDGINGINSVLSKNVGSGTFATLTAIGGGAGATAGDSAGSGGSGGGSLSGSVGTGTSGQGYSGALGISGPSYWSGGGGGGAAGAGNAAPSSSQAGSGGTGLIWLPEFDTKTATALGLTLTNQAYGGVIYFAGGGGGGSTYSYGNGGSGGGGSGSIGANNATSGTPNSGGGGGGAGCCNPGYSGAGGSGVIILRYAANAGLSLSLSTAPVYRTQTNLLATANIDGKVTFYANGRIILGCKNLVTTSKSVTCRWKPSQHGNISLTASISSTTYTGYKGTFASAIGVATRSNNR